MKKGKIITIEGTDYSGKETQTKRLFERLQKENIPCETMSFPRYDTPTGRIIGQSYLGKEDLGEGDISWFGNPDKVTPKIASLYYAADRFAAFPEINKIVESGKYLLLDRWIESNMAHQGGKAKTLKEKSDIINFIYDLEYKSLQLPKPDSILFLYMPYLVAEELKVKRNTQLDGHENNKNHLQNAEKTYLELAEIYEWKKIDCAPDGTTNSLRSIKDIGEEVYIHVKSLF